MKNKAYDHGYGDTWNDICVERRERYFTSVTDFHIHDFYEVNLILSGKVRILFSDRSYTGASDKIVFTKPDTPHFISCDPNVLYSSLYLAFSSEFVATCIPEFRQLFSVFGKNGNVISLTSAQKIECEQMILHIQTETDKTRKRLLLMYLLSKLASFSENETQFADLTPPYIIDALQYINGNYAEKITASQLAQKLFVCRTTLMTEFKKHTGVTLNNYIIHCRLQNVIKLMLDGKSENEAAQLCGFCDISGLIRAFRKHFGTTPKQYIQKGASNF